jgi:anti-anti-sigma factor
MVGSGRPLTITTEVDDGVASVRIEGQLDYDTSDALPSAVEPLLADPPRQLRLNCAGLTFCDTMGLAAILQVHQRALVHHCGFHLDDRRPQLQHLLVTTGVLEHLTGARETQWGSHRLCPGPGDADRSSSA